jgi:hypothetical protein
MVVIGVFASRQGVTKMALAVLTGTSATTEGLSLSQSGGTG